MQAVAASCCSIKLPHQEAAALGVWSRGEGLMRTNWNFIGCKPYGWEFPLLFNIPDRNVRRYCNSFLHMGWLWWIGTYLSFQQFYSQIDPKNGRVPSTVSGRTTPRMSMPILLYFYRPLLGLQISSKTNKCQVCFIYPATHHLPNMHLTLLPHPNHKLHLIQVEHSSKTAFHNDSFLLSFGHCGCR